MPEITHQQAKEFLNNITSKDNVAIIHHDDADGFCSAILYYDWCKNKSANVKQFTYELNETHLKDLKLKKFNKIIITDVASRVISGELARMTDKQIFFTDHHQRTPLPKEILELPTTQLGYIPSSRTAGELTQLKPWLSLIGTVTDAGYLYPENVKFIKNHLKKINMTYDEFKLRITNIVTNFLIYFNENPDKAFKILEKISSLEEISKLKKYSEPVEKEIKKFVKEFQTKKEKLGDINFYFINPHFSIKGAIVGILSQQKTRDVFIFASPKGKYITLSARTNDRKKNTIDIVQAGISNLKFGNAGGHPAAAGGIILAKDLEKFKQNIKKSIF